MARSCCCTGYLQNTGGVCCLDLNRGTYTFTPNTTVTTTSGLPHASAEYDRIVKLLNLLAERLEKVEAALNRPIEISETLSDAQADALREEWRRKYA